MASSTKLVGAVVGGLVGTFVMAIEQETRRSYGLPKTPAVLLPIAIATTAYMGWYLTPYGETPISSLGRLRGHPLARLAR